MGVIDLVAIIGAGAWIPQIITWGYRAWSQPKVSLHLHSLPQVGYTTLGPIFNVSLALLSDKKDAILNKFSAILKHESGATYTFDWDGLSEDLSEIQNPMGHYMSIKKTVLPLVVKVLHTGVSQAFVRFQHGQFKKNTRDLSLIALAKFNHLKNTGKLNTEEEIENLFSEQEFAEVMKVFDSEFIWKAGNYTVTFDIKSPNKFKYEKNEYTFSLSQDDINELKKNIENIKLDLIEHAKIGIIPDYEMKPVNWIWRSPELQKKENAPLQTKI